MRAKYIATRIEVAIQRIVPIGKGQSMNIVTPNKISMIANIVKMIIEKREILIIPYLFQFL
jgi:transcription termination factor Rho